MKASPLLPMLFLVLAVAVQAQEEKVTVTLEARPGDCVKSLEGAGSYLRFSQVTIRARPVANCGFVGWEIKEGMGFNFTSANPFVFYAERDFKAVAVFDRLYEGPEGGVVERVLINPVINVSLPRGLAQEPIITRPGQRVRYVFPEEIPLGEMKYVFLYAEFGGVKQESPTVELQAPEKGVLNITAYYYTYIRFLNEYFPSDQFVEVKAEKMTVSDVERKVPTHFTVAGQTFQISQKVPRQLLNLVKIVYTRQFKIVLISNGAEPAVTVNEKTLTLSPAAYLWLDEGSTLAIVYPEKFETYRLKNVSGQGLEKSRPSMMGTVKGPVTLLLEYERMPNVEFLDTPYVGAVLYGIAELGSKIVGLDGFPALMIGTAVVLSAIAAPTSAIAMASSKIGRRAPPRHETRTVLQPFITAEVEPSGTEEWENSLRAKGRIIIPPEIADTLLKNIRKDMGGRQESEADEADVEEQLFKLLSRREDELYELMNSLADSDTIETTPYLLCHLPWDRDILESLKQKRVKLVGDMGYACFEKEGLTLVKMLERGMATVVVKNHDLELGIAVVEKACEEAGLEAAVMNGVSKTDVKKAAEEIKKITGGADAVIFISPQGEFEKTIAISSTLTGKRHIIISEKPSIATNLKLPRPSLKEYIGIAAAIMTMNNLLRHLDMDDLAYLGDMAHSFRGLYTITRAAAYLSQLAEKNKQLDAQQALRQIFRQELLETFTPEELELIRQYQTVEQLKTAYISLVRQLKPGADPAKELASLLERMRRLNMVVGEP